MKAFLFGFGVYLVVFFIMILLLAYDIHPTWQTKPITGVQWLFALLGLSIGAALCRASFLDN